MPPYLASGYKPVSLTRSFTHTHTHTLVHTHTHTHTLVHTHTHTRRDLGHLHTPLPFRSGKLGPRARDCCQLKTPRPDSCKVLWTPRSTSKECALVGPSLKASPFGARNFDRRHAYSSFDLASPLQYRSTERHSRGYSTLQAQSMRCFVLVDSGGIFAMLMVHWVNRPLFPKQTH